MKLFIRKNIYTISVSFITIISFILVGFVYHESKFIAIENTLPLANLLRVLFVISFFAIGLHEFLKTNNRLQLFFSFRNFLISSIIFSLVLSITEEKTAYYSAGIFVFFALVYFLKERKLYAFNKVFIFLILFALMQIIGAFFTDSSFKFPEKIYSFLIFPFAYCLFDFKKQTYLRILKIVFRVLFVYICITLVFWIFNVRAYDASLVEWITTKLIVKGVEMPYELIGFWSLYHHPSYISLVLLSTLVVGFYLFYKKSNTAYISLTEIVAYSVALLVLELAYESRIGIVATILIITISVFYYMRLKSSFLKLSIFIVIFLGGSFFLFISDEFAGMRNDNVRKVDYTLAVNYIKDHFWWGTGTGMQRFALMEQEEIMKDELPKVSDKKTYVHNQFLGEMVQFGITGLVVLLVVLGGLVFYSIKTRSYLLQLLMFIYILFMLIEEPFYVQPGISRFIVFFALFVAISETETVKKHIDLRQWLAKSKPS